jgi:hypothetical protein
MNTLKNRRRTQDVCIDPLTSFDMVLDSYCFRTQGTKKAHKVSLNRVSKRSRHSVG